MRRTGSPLFASDAELAAAVQSVRFMPTYTPADEAADAIQRSGNVVRSSLVLSHDELQAYDAQGDSSSSSSSNSGWDAGGEGSGGGSSTYPYAQDQLPPMLVSHASSWDDSVPLYAAGAIVVGLGLALVSLLYVHRWMIQRMRRQHAQRALQDTQAGAAASAAAAGSHCSRASGDDGSDRDSASDAPAPPDEVHAAAEPGNAAAAWAT
jgi:hypothetical protein